MPDSIQSNDPGKRPGLVLLAYRGEGLESDIAYWGNLIGRARRSRDLVIEVLARRKWRRLVAQREGQA